ncbi:MAG TPA: arginase family protein, partial [Kiritimatiellia bacterium]|nr:arginase family protein [Kiritimatiellia bacterium]
LAASQQLEACDAEGRLTPARIHTQRAVSSRSRDPEVWIAAVEKRVAQTLACRSVPVLLGGEHTVSLGAARAFHAARDLVGFIQFDAHADLRGTYEGSPLSHACVMRRIHELGFPCLQIATRAVSPEEQEYRKAHRSSISFYDARVIADDGMSRHFIPRGFPKRVYITFDLDGLDPAVLPATGTPVPGGLFWYDAIRILRRIAATRDIVGLDVVELAPNRASPHADFTAALLTQTLMGFAAASPTR